MFISKNFTIFTYKGIPTILTGWWLTFIALIYGLAVFAAASKDGFTFNLLYEEFPFLTITAYGCVLLHEYGHALTARYLGYKTGYIKIYPFSGVAAMDGEWYKVASHEFWITINGPLVNLALAAIVSPFWGMNEAVNFFIIVNLMIAGFNFLPIYPMDGGRILRATLNYIFQNWQKATNWAAAVSILTAIAVVPFVWTLLNPVAALLISFMAFVICPLEVWSMLQMEKLKRQEDELLNQAEINENISLMKSRQIARDYAQNTWPDDKQAQDGYVYEFNVFHRFTTAVNSSIIRILLDEKYDDEKILKIIKEFALSNSNNCVVEKRYEINRKFILIDELTEEIKDVAERARIRRATKKLFTDPIALDYLQRPSDVDYEALQTAALDKLQVDHKERIANQVKTIKDGAYEALKVIKTNRLNWQPSGDNK